MCVRSLGQEDSVMATHSSILAWRIHGQRSLVGYSPWGHKESITTEVTQYVCVCVYNVYMCVCVYIYIYMSCCIYRSCFIYIYISYIYIYVIYVCVYVCVCTCVCIYIYKISLQSRGLSRVFPSTIIQKHPFFSTQPSYGPNYKGVFQGRGSHP